MAKLRAPDGCPWDREQTHRSICDCLVEEVCELLQAIDREASLANPCERILDPTRELGRAERDDVQARAPVRGERRVERREVSVDAPVDSDMPHTA